MADIISKVKSGSETYRIEDTATKQALIQEVERSVKAENEIKDSIEKLKATTDSAHLRIDGLMDPEREGSIQKTVDAELAKVINTSPSNLESLRGISEWFEEDETGASAVVGELGTCFKKENIEQGFGDSEYKVMSQKATTEAISNIVEKYQSVIDGGRADTVFGGARSINCGGAGAF